MKFEEKNAKRYEKKENKQGYIYFLIKDEEVVYVGQTTSGISRPLSHKDKDFDYFYMKKCPFHLLDKRENEMIFKYNPKYNGAFNICDKWVGRNSIYKELLAYNISIRPIFFDKIAETVGVKQFVFKVNKGVTQKDKVKIVKYIKKNWDKISFEQKQSLSIKFYENSEIDKNFCAFVSYDLAKNGYYYNLSYLSVKDLLYFGFIDEEYIANAKKEFEDKGCKAFYPISNEFHFCNDCYPKKYNFEFVKKNGLR